MGPHAPPERQGNVRAGNQRRSADYLPAATEDQRAGSLA
jgi:hypothetical protein